MILQLGFLAMTGGGGGGSRETEGSSEPGATSGSVGWAGVGTGAASCSEVTAVSAFSAIAEFWVENGSWVALELTAGGEAGAVSGGEAGAG